MSTSKSTMESTGLAFEFQPFENQSYNFTDLKDFFEERIPEDHEDFYHKIFANVPLNWVTLVVYLMGLGCCFLLGMVSVFERTGLAGPYRPIINQLASFCIDQLILMYVIPVGIEVLRAIWGPLPSAICSLKIWTHRFAGLNFVLLCTSTTLVRFVIICVHKSLRTMDDNFIAMFFYMATTMVAFLGVLGTLYTRRNVPTFEKICTGFWIENDYEEDQPTLRYIVFFCIFCHIVMNAAISWRERTVQILPIHVNHLQNAPPTVMVDTLTGLTLLVFGILFLVNRIYAISFTGKDYENLSPEFAQWYYANQASFLPFLIVLGLTIYFLGKKKQVRNYIKDTLSMC